MRAGLVVPALSLLVALLVAPSPWPAASAVPDCAPLQSAEAPVAAARDGAPFVLLLEPSVCADAAFTELRAWIGNATHQASRVWNGTAWVASTGYVPLSVFVTDAGRLAVPLRAVATATNGPTLVQAAEEAEVFVRFRGPGGSAPATSVGSVVWVDGGTARWSAARQPWLEVRDAQQRLLGSAPAGFDADGTPLPSSFAWMALPPQAPPGEPAPVVPGDVLVVRVAPDLAPGAVDALDFVNRGDAPFPLRGLRVVDGEGELHVALVPGAPGQLPPGAGARLSSGAVDGLPPLSGLVWNASWRDADFTGRFALAQGGDAVALLYGDQVLDVLAYGTDADAPGGWSGAAVEAARVSGRIFMRAQADDAWADTDSAADWSSPRVYRQHQVDRAAAWTQADQVRAFVCPDRCWEEALLRIEAATTSLDVNLYDLSLKEAVDALAHAADRGVTVRVLLDPRPVAASATKMDRIAWAVDTLVAHGASVRVHERSRFDYDHAKYLVADGAWTFVVSENANDHGWPTDGAAGNRGWGVAVQDEGLAGWMSALFAADFLHPVDTRAVSGLDLNADLQAPVWDAPAAPVAGRVPTLVVPGPVAVRPVVAPEHLGDPASSALVAALAGAAESIRFQQLNLPLTWSRPGWSDDSPLVVALVDAAARGVVVRGVVADAFVDGLVETDGNDRTAAVLSALPQGLDVRLGAAPHPAGIVHNKGWIVDGRLVFVGSANGNLASQAMNREVDLLVDDARVAEYFAAAFDADFVAAPPAALADEVAPAVALPAPSAVVAWVLVLVGGLGRSVLMERRARRAERG